MIGRPGCAIAADFSMQSTHSLRRLEVARLLRGCVRRVAHRRAGRGLQHPRLVRLVRRPLQVKPGRALLLAVRRDAFAVAEQRGHLLLRTRAASRHSRPCRRCATSSGSSSGCAKPMPSSHIAALPCRNRLCDSFQLKPATPCGPYFASSVWYIFADFDRFRRIGHQLALGIDEAAAVAEQEARPHRHVRVLEPAPDEARNALPGSLSFAAASIISANVFG